MQPKDCVGGGIDENARLLRDRNVLVVRNIAMELISDRESHGKKMFSDFENFTNSRN